MTKTEIAPEVLECLPPEAHEAIRTGGNWDGTPDSVEGSSTWYSQDDGGWWSNWYPTGYVVEDGKLYLRVMTVDSDGNWDVADEAEVGTPDEARLEAEYGYQAWLKNYEDYLRWVAKHGEDPVGEFMVEPAIKTKQAWRAECNESILGVVLVRARQENGAWLPPAKLPPEVLAYLQAKKEKRVWIMGDFAKLADLEACIAGSTDLRRHRVAGGGIGVGFTVTVARPNPHYKSQLIKRAKASLKGK